MLRRHLSGEEYQIIPIPIRQRNLVRHPHPNQTMQFSTPSESSVNTGYPIHHPAHGYSAYHPAHHWHHGHYSYGQLYTQLHPNTHSTKQPVHTTHEQSIQTVIPCNSNEEQSIPMVNHPTSNGCKRHHLLMKEGTPQQHEVPRKRQQHTHPPIPVPSVRDVTENQCDHPGCTKLRKEGTLSRFCPQHFGGVCKGGRPKGQTNLSDADLKQREVKKRELKAKANMAMIVKQHEDSQRRDAEKRRLKAKANMAMIVKQHEESQRRDAEKRSNLEQAIQEIDGHIISNDHEASATNATNDFSPGTTHALILNMKNSDAQLIPSFRGILIATILESLDGIIYP